MSLSTTLKPAKCKHCRKRLERIGQTIHEDCVDPWWAANQEKVKARAAKAAARKVRLEKAETKKALAKLATPKQRAKTAKAKAQDAFNAWVRARDADLPCVSCGATDPPMTPGGQWDAGHFLGRGAYPELCVTEDNCHKQCKACNSGSSNHARKGRTVREDYEAELLNNRLGPERLAALKAPHPPLHYTDDDWNQIAATYRAKRKQLEKEQG